MITWIMVVGVAAVFFVGSAWLFNKLGHGPLGRWYAGKPGRPAPGDADEVDDTMLASQEENLDRFAQEPVSTESPER